MGEDDFPHIENRCLHCLSISKGSSKNSIKSGSRKSHSKDKEEKKSSRTSLDKPDNAKKKFSTSSLPQIDPNSEDRFLVHKEILRLIVNLSSSVASKASQQGLIT